MSFEINVNALWERLGALGKSRERSSENVNQKTGQNAREMNPAAKEPKTNASSSYDRTPTKIEQPAYNQASSMSSSDKSSLYSPAEDLSFTPPPSRLTAEYLSYTPPPPSRLTVSFTPPPSSRLTAVDPSLSVDTNPNQDLQEALVNELKARQSGSSHSTVAEDEKDVDPYSTEIEAAIAPKDPLVASEVVHQPVGPQKTARFLIVYGARKEGPRQEPFNVAFYKKSYSYYWEDKNTSNIVNTLVRNLSKILSEEDSELLPNILFVAHDKERPITIQWFEVNEIGKITNGSETHQSVTLAELIGSINPRFIVDLSPRTDKIYVSIDSLVKPDAAQFKITNTNKRVIETYKLIQKITASQFELKKYIAVPPANFCYDVSVGTAPFMYDPVLNASYQFNQPAEGICLAQLINFAKYFGVKIQIFDQSSPLGVKKIQYNSASFTNASYVAVYIFGKMRIDDDEAFNEIKRENFRYFLASSLDPNISEAIEAAGSVIKNISAKAVAVTERTYINPRILYFNGTTFELSEKNMSNVRLSAILKPFPAKTPVVIYEFSK